ncbi:MAG: methyltransferase domain-containing protein [Chitinivibrionales bacterium]|nr:methyltransferase domain-containing protein [Chitinivibrionales bacterium]
MHHMVPDKKLIAGSFSKKAGSYGSYAQIQRLALQKCAQYAQELHGNTAFAIDLGCGTGLYEEISGAVSHKMVCLDIAGQCLKRINTGSAFSNPCVCADIEMLPFKKQVFEMAVLASVLQWLSSPGIALQHINGILCLGGTVLYAIFLKGSFNELNETQQEYAMKNPVHFFSLDECKCLFNTAGFRISVQETLQHTQYFNSPLAALKSLAGTGSTAVGGNRLRGHELFDFCRTYDKRYRGENGVPVTYHLLVGRAEKIRNTL